MPSLDHYQETANRALSAALSQGLNRTTRVTVDVKVPVVDLTKAGTYVNEVVTVSYPRPSGVRSQIWLNADDTSDTYRQFFVFTDNGWQLLGSQGLVANPENTVPTAPLSASATRTAATDPKAPASGAWTVQEDQPLHVVAGSPLDFSARIPTAIPAGSRGRVVAVGDNLQENGVTVKFNVATWVPDAGFYWIPATNAEITAGLQHLVRSGYNALRIHGIENYILSGQTGEWSINTDRLAKFDFILSEAKRLGLYWVINPMSWWLGKDMEGATNRFPAHSDGGYKSRIYTHQNIRDHWTAGFNAIYNRVNVNTGINILQDPALLMAELYNESEVAYIGAQCGNNGFPAVWLTRDVGATSAAKTFGEWLTDPTQAHGYADVAAIATAYSTAWATPTDVITAVSATSFWTGGNNGWFNGNVGGTFKVLDVNMYAAYLEDNMAAFYASAVSTFNLQCLVSQTTSTNPSLLNFRSMASSSTNSVVNTHAYPLLADNGLDVGSTLSKANEALWAAANRFTFASSMWGAGGKPNWFGEYGFPAWAKYRAQFPLWVAALIQNNASGVSYFCQGRFWEPSYKKHADATTAQRFGRVFPYVSHGDPAGHFASTLVALLQHGGVLTRLSSKVDYLTNLKSFGWSNVGGNLTRVAGRAGRLTGVLNRPMVYAAMLGRAQITYDPDINATDDSYASVNLARSFKLFQSDMLPVKTVSGVITSGSYGGYTASATQPIFTLGTPLYDNTVTGDKLFFTNLAGSGGSWPGTTQATVACTVTVIDSQHVQATSGVNLTGLSGFTAGTYCEASAHFQSMYNNNGNIVSVSTTGTFYGATATTTQPVLVLGANGGSSGTVSLVTGDEVYITNLTGTGGTGGSWPGTGFKGSSLTATVLDAATNTVQVSAIPSALPSGLASVAPTAGTWCEGMNVVEGRFREWGLSSRLQRAWINTKKLVAFFNGPSTTFPVALQNVSISALTNDASLFVAALDDLPLTSSTKILVGMVGDAQNSGMKFSDGAARKTIADGGTYPIQMADNYAKLTFTRTAYGNPKVTPLSLSGERLDWPSKLVVDSTTFTVEIQNAATGSVFWLIEV